MVKTPNFHCRGWSFNPWSGNQDPTCFTVWPTSKWIIKIQGLLKASIRDHCHTWNNNSLILSLVRVSNYNVFFLSLAAPCDMWDLSFLIRDRTCTPCIGRWSRNHWTTREVPVMSFLTLHVIHWVDIAQFNHFLAIQVACRVSLLSKKALGQAFLCSLSLSFGSGVIVS